MKNRLLSLFVLFLSAASGICAQTKASTFEKYAVKKETIRNIKVNLKSHKQANMYRTNLRNAAKDGVNFAGHFVFASWFCGTGCNDGAVIDARSGKVFFPPELAGIGLGFCDLPDKNLDEPLVYKPDSRLLVLSGFKGGEMNSKTSRCGIYYFEWTGASFRQVKFIQKKRLEMP